MNGKSNVDTEGINFSREEEVLVASGPAAH